MKNPLKRKSFSNVIFLVLFVSVYCVKIYGQHISLPQSIQSPNAASLGKYGDVPVSYYFGTANVSVPLYLIEELNIPLDIFLNYDTSGVRVNAVPGWVGQNWSLNAGGVITRSVQGKAFDEMLFESPSPNWQLGQKGYLHHLQKLNRNDWSAVSYMDETIYSSISIGSDYLQDLEPDIFTFNFMGYSGKFFLSEDGSWKVFSDSNLKVIIDTYDFVQPLNLQEICTPCFNGAKFPKVIGKITIIDDKGTTYVFGEYQNAIEYNFPDFFDQVHSAPYSNAWYLTKVIDHFGNVVYEFEYSRGDFIANFYRYAIQTYNKTIGGNPLDPQCDTGQIENMNGEYSSGQLIVPSYLNKITTFSGDTFIFNSQISNGMRFLASDDGIYQTFSKWADDHSGSDDYLFYFWQLTTDGSSNPLPMTGQNEWESLMNRLVWRKLINIQTPTNTISFTYNDAFNPSLPSKRLNLLSVKVDDRNYSFEYDRFDQLPHFLSKSFDHWGYYKDGDYYVQGTGFSPSLHYNSRETNIDRAKIGSLVKIKYPTGGWTEFEYEVHEYSKAIDENRNLESIDGIAGGLRIKRVTNNDNTGNTYSRFYKYTQDFNGGESTGILSIKNKYYWPEWKVKSNSGTTLIQETFSLNNLFPLANTMGYHMGYSKVHEILEDGSYSTYEYTNYSDEKYKDIPFVSTINISHSIFDSYVDKSLMRGKLKKKSLYDTNGFLKKRNSYLYNENEYKKVRAIDYDILHVCNADKAWTGTAYEIYYFDPSLVYEKEETFLDGRPFERETAYQWISEDEDTNSSGDSFLRSKTIQVYKGFEGQNAKNIREDYQYSFDFFEQPYLEMKNKRNFDLINTKVYENADRISETQINYGYFTVNGIQQVLPKENLKAFGNAELEQEAIVDGYDSQGRIQQLHKKNGLYTVILYKDKYPVARLEGYTQHSAGIIDYWNSQIKSTTFSNLIGKLQELRNYFSGDMVTTYTFIKNIGIASITDSRGRTEHYKYDLNNRLKQIVDAEGKILKEFEYNFKGSN